MHLETKRERERERERERDVYVCVKERALAQEKGLWLVSQPRVCLVGASEEGRRRTARRNLEEEPLE